MALDQETDHLGASPVADARGNRELPNVAGSRRLPDPRTTGRVEVRDAIENLHEVVFAVRIVVRPGRTAAAVHARGIAQADERPAAIVRGDLKPDTLGDSLGASAWRIASRARRSSARARCSTPTTPLPKPFAGTSPAHTEPPKPRSKS